MNSKRVLPKGDVPINTVAISPEYAKSIVTRDPINIFTIRLRDKDDDFSLALVV